MEDGAEGICLGIIDAVLEVGGVDSGEDVSPTAEQKGKSCCIPFTAHETRQCHDPPTIYLLKLNLRYQMLFFTRRVKFSASRRNAGLQKNRETHIGLCRVLGAHLFRYSQ